MEILSKCFSKFFNAVGDTIQTRPKSDLMIRHLFFSASADELIEIVRLTELTDRFDDYTYRG